MTDAINIGRSVLFAVVLACVACGGTAAPVGGACAPACSPGFTCQDGVCLFLCNPACRAGYACVLQGRDARCEAIPDAGAVADAPAPPPPDVPPSDPRPPEERACPNGARLRVQLWDVYAMPRQPDGSPWDGVSPGFLELACNVTAGTVADAVRRALDGQFPGSGELFDLFVRRQVQDAVARSCGLAANWLQQHFEGPDMFALGGEAGATIWQTPAVQDAWQASLRTTTRGAPAEWTGQCRSGTRSQLAIVDEDLAKDDRVGAIAFSLDTLTPQMICGGWVTLQPFEGVAYTVMRVQVEGARQNCEGLLPSSMEEVTLPYEPPAAPPTPPSRLGRP